MSNLFAWVSKMLAVYGQPVAERAAVYVDAIAEEHLCEACAVEATRMLVRTAKRRPTPADLLAETRETMGTGIHAQHIPERAQLSAGGTEGWWRLEAPALVRRTWPELDEAQTQAVCQELQRQASVGLVEATADGPLGVRANLGEPGTTERRWWERFLRMRAASPAGGR